MNSGVSVLIPTRGRPKRLEQCIGSIKKTAAGEVEALTYVDDDDDSYTEWGIKGPRVERAKMFKALIEKARHPWLMICGDDVIFETKGWDLEMIKPIPEDRIGIVFGIDGWKNTPGHLLFHRRFYELTGCFPDEFEHFGIDTYMSDVMRGVERFFQVQVMLRHMHHRNGKAEIDDTYMHPRQTGMSKRDEERLKGFRKSRMPKDIEILKAEIERFRNAVQTGSSDAKVSGDQQA